jgi:N-methylhydantoinase A/oxoprolinase/acetone carboxylase beta subunit
VPAIRARSHLFHGLSQLGFPVIPRKRISHGIFRRPFRANSDFGSINVAGTLGQRILEHDEATTPTVTLPTWRIVAAASKVAGVALDEDVVVAIAASLREAKVEAVAVCLLWSIVNPAHETRVGELLAEHLPGVPFTLSYRVNPSLREYRRASSTCIDASLKPLMSRYVGGMTERLREEGFAGW